MRDLTWGYAVVTGAGNLSAPRGIINIPVVRYHRGSGFSLQALLLMFLPKE